MKFAGCRIQAEVVLFGRMPRGHPPQACRKHGGKSRQYEGDTVFGLGTIINTLAIVLGGLAGHFFGKLLKDRHQTSRTAACGISVLFIGIAGAMQGMLSVRDGVITSGRAMLVTVLYRAAGSPAVKSHTFASPQGFAHEYGVNCSYFTLGIRSMDGDPPHSST